MNDSPDSTPDFSGSGPVEYNPDVSTSSTFMDANALIIRIETQLLKIEGVVSVGIGHGPAGMKTLEVGVVDYGVSKMLPREIEGVPVVVTVIGSVEAHPQR